LRPSNLDLGEISTRAESLLILNLVFPKSLFLRPNHNIRIAL